ncbi:MAG: DUF1826 domain-containing protein [Pseudomonadota bacterium]
MNVQRLTLKDAAIGVAVADAPEALTTFLKPGCAAAIWRRRPDPDFQSWIDGLLPEQLPRGRLILRPETVPQAIVELCKVTSMPLCKECGVFAEDVAAVAQNFSDLLDVEYVRLRLDVVTTNACRKFHIDAVTARLVCTYRGSGTQYGISTNGNDPRRVFSVPTGSPILLRGTHWPDDPPSGLLHRSPPIEGTGESRLVLVLDPISNPEDEH